MRNHYDVLVVGAGPAGTLAARQVARRGRSVLLVDKAIFPRPKVCGCCVNRAALASLEQVGVKIHFNGSRPVPLQRLDLSAGGRTVSLKLPGGIALSRSVLDQALVDEAVKAGVQFLDGVAAKLIRRDDAMLLTALRHVGTSIKTHQVESRVVIAADGLGGRFLRDVTTFRIESRPGSRMGISSQTPAAPDWIRRGTIYMACSTGGYVGLVRLEDGSLNTAAAIDALFVRALGGPAQAVSAILKEAAPGWAGENLQTITWQGTPTLTRRRSPLAADRIFVIGDAAGYVEPFTGEGIAWALRSGVAVAEMANEAVDRWDADLADQWTSRYRRLIGHHHRDCRWITTLLRWPKLARVVISLIDVAPSVAQPLVKKISSRSPYPTHESW